MKDNLKVIESYPEGVAVDYLWKIGATRVRPLEMSSLPVVVTAMDKDYYPFSQGMFLTLHKGVMKYYNNTIQLIVYDLGMTPRQRNVVIYPYAVSGIFLFRFIAFKKYFANTGTHIFSISFKNAKKIEDKYVYSSIYCFNVQDRSDILH